MSKKTPYATGKELNDHATLTNQSRYDEEKAEEKLNEIGRDIEAEERVEASEKERKAIQSMADERNTRSYANGANRMDEKMDKRTKEIVDRSVSVLGQPGRD